MGAGASHLQADEAALLLAFSGEEPLPYDSEKWVGLFHFKVRLDSLTAEQRMKLLDVHLPNRFLHRASALLAAAAAIALAFVTKDAWLPKGSGSRVAQVSGHMTDYVQAVSAESEDFVNQLASFRKLTEEPGKWLPSQAPAGANVLGPPSSLMNSEIPRKRSFCLRKSAPSCPRSRRSELELTRYTSWKSAEATRMPSSDTVWRQCCRMESS